MEFRGWEVQYSDGTIINEEQMSWKSLSKVNIVRVSLKYDGRQWDILNKPAYLQKKRASMVPGVAESFRAESRSIGYYDEVDGKSCKVWYTVEEDTGKMTVNIEESK